ncbi:putative RWD domain-containing protein 2B [Cardiosporidium cionae]|uniref:RWD domain-containing protein 2B n=1 Tax=Cardiosporidium cionae TaxID=476202 RepID=A0ABQ7JBY9_9APIC|nr:putative RWD domain-containing protein 2B [Cardiosporidium cionae]|eukprot:KAF8821486.1 putative RWD domain-containing protein 2B [Cardiosporidium cionae]
MDVPSSSYTHLDRQIYDIIFLHRIYSLPGEFTMDFPACKDDIDDEQLLRMLIRDNSPDISIFHTDLPSKLENNLMDSIQSQCNSMIGEECLYQVVREAHDKALTLLAALPSQESVLNAPSSHHASSEEEEEETLSLSGLQELPSPLNFPSSTALQNTLFPILGRRLCYSHHILASGKRRCIINWAVELQLGGFSKIGYPGVIIVEGPEHGCYEYVNRLQRLRWKHFVCRGEDIQRGTADETVDSMRKLPRGFLELGPDGMGKLADACRMAGLEELFLTCMKIYRPVEEKSFSTSSHPVNEKFALKKQKKKKKNATVRR